MKEKCPVCQADCEEDATACSVCGFADELGINRKSAVREDLEEWKKAVLMYRDKWEAEKQKRKLQRQLEAARQKEAKLKAELEAAKKSVPLPTSIPQSSSLPSTTTIQQIQSMSQPAHEIKEKTASVLASVGNIALGFIGTVFHVIVIFGLFVFVIPSEWGITRGIIWGILLGCSVANLYLDALTSDDMEPIRICIGIVIVSIGSIIVFGLIQGVLFGITGGISFAISAFIYCIIYKRSTEGFRSIMDLVVSLVIIGSFVIDFIFLMIWANNTNKAKTHFDNGNTHYNKKDYAKAIEDYSAAIERKPNDVVYLYSRGVAYNGNNDYDKAIADFEAALRLDPNYDQAKQNLKNAQQTRDNLKQNSKDIVAKQSPSGSISGSVGGIGTKAKGSIKAPSAKDIDMSSSDGSRSKAEIMQVVNARMPGLRNIYNKHLKLKPGFSGKVTLRFTIAPAGDIISISIVSSTTGYSEFDEEVKNMVSTWKWKFIKGGNITPTIPFNFTE